MSRIEALASALMHAHATLPGLDRAPFEKTEWVKARKAGSTVRKRHDNRCRVWMFDQTWGSTALGFGGIGGQAMTTAATVVVEGPMGDCCVYFGGRLAYRLNYPPEGFWKDLAAHAVLSAREAVSLYGAVVPVQGSGSIPS